MNVCNWFRLSTGVIAAGCLTVWLMVTGLAAGKWDFKLSADEQRALAAITPAALQVHVSFLAADALDGRGAGTQGLEVASEYVAAQFRGARLKPAGDAEYFQTTPRVRLAPAPDGYRCLIALDGRTVTVPASQFAVVGMFGSAAPSMRELHVDQAPVYKIPFGADVPDRIDEAARTVIVTDSPVTPAEQSQVAPFLTRRAQFASKLALLQPALIVEVRRDASRARDYFAASVLVDPENRPRPFPGPPIVALNGDAGASAYDELPAGPTGALFTVHLNTPVEKSAPQRNVIGVLPGSDPSLAGTYVLVTSHYDGQGTRPGPDPVWNSANDNATGTASVVALASALSALQKRTRRSIAFVAFHGEESGLVGSRYYAQHPVLPIEKTVADLNIEMVGRTDDVDGDQHKRASVTGFDYSDVGEVFRRAGALTGITVFKHPKNSDPYFLASDNQALAVLGVPAHTVCVTFQYPDYHGAADTWQKIDYDNMALTVRMIGAALIGIADSREEPHWDPAVTRASRYIEAWKKLHGTGQRP
jgi:hypothetical protein